MNPKKLILMATASVAMATSIMATQQLSGNHTVPFPEIIEWAKTDNYLQERIGVYTSIKTQRINHNWIAASNFSIRIQLPSGKDWQPKSEVMELNATGQIVEMSYSNRTATIRCSESNIVVLTVE